MMKVCVNGAKGKMGQTLVDFINGSSELELVATVDFEEDLAQAIQQNDAQLIIDFTTPEIRMQTVKIALYNNCAIVVGTTGFTTSNLTQINIWVEETGKGCFIAPNFIIGNVLMQQFAAKAAQYYQNAEIIEYHHEQKVDAPSGTALKTAELMGEARQKFNQHTNDKVNNIAGSRGADYQGIKIHAVRLPGFIASQEVILGDDGQYLTIRHDSVNRQCYMAGVFMAAKYIFNKAELIYGLEKIL